VMEGMEEMEEMEDSEGMEGRDEREDTEGREVNGWKKGIGRRFCCRSKKGAGPEPLQNRMVVFIYRIINIILTINVPLIRIVQKVIFYAGKIHNRRICILPAHKITKQTIRISGALVFLLLF
jgi:hypothetical protein